MCQTIWAIGNEVKIRKAIKLPRAERLAKFQWFCDSVLKGAELMETSLVESAEFAYGAAARLPPLQGSDKTELLCKLVEWKQVLR